MDYRINNIGPIREKESLFQRRLNDQLRHIQAVLRDLDGRVDALAADVEKLRTAKGVGDDNPASP